MALNTTLVKSTVVAALGGLLFGFDTAVIAGATSALTSNFQLTPGGLGLTVSIALWGTVAGALLASIPGDRYGRRDSLRVMAIFYLVSALGSAFATNWYALIFFRFIGGLAIGGSSVLGPMYITEIAPAKWRGRLVGFFQFNVVAGILLAYLSNYLVGLSLQGSSVEWRWKLGISALPAALFFLMLFGIPRSPRWLARKGRTAEARSVLEAIGEENIDSELRAMNDASELEKREGQEHLFTARNRLPLFLAFSIAFFNQFSGINAILYYLNDIFARAGFSKVSSDLQAVAIGGTNLLFTMLAMSIIDHVGRRTLLLIGSVGTALCLAGAAAIFWTGRNEALLVWLLIGFIASFAFSQGAVIWVYLSEIFPTAVRARGQSLGSSTHWVMNALISWTFPIIATYSKAAPFVVFSAMMVLQFFIVFFFYPETKNIVLEDMQKKLSTI
ncbi:MAG TPA: sugar porter family MFS transporter [Terriglobales bacterium]|nr:sugar porter family MFS transporter [Terriglobales bacterium]